MTRAVALDEDTLAAYLVRLGIAPPDVVLRVEAAGDGNINWVRRVRSSTPGISWIVKQARPALERFPQYRASTSRILAEARWFEIAQRLDREGVCPRVLHVDESERALVLEDLGDAERLDSALARGADVGAALAALARLLGAVHAATAGDAALADHFPNADLRALHGEHIFALPYRPNDFPLSPRVRARAEALGRDAALVALAGAAHARYREARDALVHGDVQAGNVLLTATGPKLLDAEIAHLGDPAFDVGTLVAHVQIAALARRTDARAGVAALWRSYRDACGSAPAPPFAAAARYAGLELMRRTIGAARVPLLERDEVALAAIDFAERLIRQPPEAP
jgi:5-methylthioribose kinase